MDENTSSGLCDETLGKFGEFMKMIEETLYLSEIDIQCAVCLNLLQRSFIEGVVNCSGAWFKRLKIFWTTSSGDFFFLFSNLKKTDFYK